MKKNIFKIKKKEDLRTLVIFGPDGNRIGKPLEEVSSKLEAWVDNHPNQQDTSKWLSVLVVGYRSGKKKYFEVNEYGMVELPVDNPNATNGQFTFDEHIIYKYYNRNDEKVNGKVEQDTWGIPENVAKFINIAIEYREYYEGKGWLEFGDLSTEKGGSPRFWDSKRKAYRPHASHYKGSQIDLRYMYKNGETIIGLGSQASFKADIDRVQTIINIANKYGMNLIGLGIPLKEGVKGEGKIFFNSEHNNHIHIGIK